MAPRPWGGASRKATELDGTVYSCSSAPEQTAVETTWSRRYQHLKNNFDHLIASIIPYVKPTYYCGVMYLTFVCLDL